MFPLVHSDQIIRKVVCAVREGDHGSPGEHLSYTSLESFLYLLARTALLNHSLFHLVGCLQLLHYRYFEPHLHELLRVLLKAFLGEADVHLAAHPLEIEKLVAHCCVLVKQLVKFTQLEQHYLIEVTLFYLPVLLHRFSQTLQGLLWDEKCRRIVVRVVWLPPLCISAPLSCSPLWSYVSEILNRLYSFRIPCWCACSLFNDCLFYQLLISFVLVVCRRPWSHWGSSDFSFGLIARIR